MAIISGIKENSIAEELEIQAGDELVSIDNVELKDLIDYNFYTKTEELTILIKKKNGELEEIELEKDYDEDLGLIFESAVFDKVKPCLNKCIFCFVDQQPKGLRDTLYIKDDDYRLSYLQGTYITMTNLKDEDRERISKLMLGPLYISVHTTNPELRVKMLKNPNAANIINDLKWLKKHQIPIHVQIVLCPEYNDGAELERTLSDLAKFKSIILSTAIVPVGLTQFRKTELKPVTKEIAEKTIEISIGDEEKPVINGVSDKEITVGDEIDSVSLVSHLYICICRLNGCLIIIGILIQVWPLLSSCPQCSYGQEGQQSGRKPLQRMSPSVP